MEAVGRIPRKFWPWFLGGSGFRGNWRAFLDRWLIVHAVVGVVAAWLVPVPLAEAAKSVLLPLAGVFVGMSFAWIGNALAILQSDELARLVDVSDGGIEDYVHPYQSAILAILVTLVAWGLAALGVFDRSCSWNCPPQIYFAVSASLFALASITLRECWHVVSAAQMLLLTQRYVKTLPPGDDRPV